MKIALIIENSQAAKSDTVFNALKTVAEPLTGTTIDRMSRMATAAISPAPKPVPNTATMKEET